MLSDFEWLVFGVLYWSAQALTLWAFVDALVRPAPGFVAAGKLTKPAWTLILGLGVVLQLLLSLGLLHLVFTIAAFVYLADVRPALAGLHRR